MDSASVVSKGVGPTLHKGENEPVWQNVDIDGKT